MGEKARTKLYEHLPSEVRAVTPTSLLLSERVPMSASEYPMHYLLAVEVDSARLERYRRLARGRRGE